MKEIIVTIALVLLGTFIVGYVNGNGDNTIKSSTSAIWQNEISRQNTYP